MSITVRIEGAETITDTLLTINGDLGDEALLKKIAEVVETRIRERTAKGIDVRGKKFKPYSETYAKRRTKAGKSAALVDLKFTGEMLRSMKTSINQSKKEVVLHFDDPDQARKAHFHNSEGAGRGRVIREFFGLSEEDKIAIADVVRAHVVETIQRRWNLH